MKDEAYIYAPAQSTNLPSRLRRYLRVEAHVFHPACFIAFKFASSLPYGVLGKFRVMAYRLAGFKGIHPRTRMHGPVEIRGGGDVYNRLVIEEGTTINSPCFLDLNAPISIGRRVGIGHHVAIITSAHALGTCTERRGRLQPKGVTIGDGAWIGAGSTIMPGVKIGRGSVVAAGALVINDVPENTMTAGVPAKPVKSLDSSEKAPQISIADN